MYTNNLTCCLQNTGRKSCSLMFYICRMSGGRLYLKGGLSGSKPGWFNNYDFARIVGKEGIEKGDILIGDRVQVTYIDPCPGKLMTRYRWK